MNTPGASPSVVGRTRDSYGDVLRGIAIVGVVCIHFGGSFITVKDAWTPAFWLGLVLDQTFSFAVPLFVFLSGYYSGRVAERNAGSLARYYGKRFARIGLPYLVASLAAFLFLYHLREWNALSGFSAKATWLCDRLLFNGVEPTLYFVPLILQLYLLQPILRGAPVWLYEHRLFKGYAPTRIILVLSGVLLVVHCGLAGLCYKHVLNYYVWGRPCALFWMFYFFVGIHWKALVSTISLNSTRRLLILGMVIAAAALAMDFAVLLDRTIVGQNYETTPAHLAYVRPEIVLFNFGVVLTLGLGLTRNWRWQLPPLEFLGRHSLAIFLWHILFLFEVAWRHAEVINGCRLLPETIPLVILFACFAISFGATAVESMRLLFVRERRNG